MIEEIFARLATDNAPGQEVRLQSEHLPLQGDSLGGRLVDFSHGDVDAFPPPPGALETFVAGFESGGKQAYTEYRGRLDLREIVAERLAKFTGAPIRADEELIVTPGTQGALFLAVASTVTAGDKVAIVQPDYFANRKLVQFLNAEIVPVRLDYLGATDRAGLNLEQLEEAFRSGVRVLIISNPNNPTGVIYSAGEIAAIASLAERFGVTVIVDELYSRQIYDGRAYVHLRTAEINPDNVVTIIGPSKTESLSGFRLGVAFGSPKIIDRMEKLQAIVSLRAAGYSQAVIKTWFDEPSGWLAERTAQHCAIRDDLLAKLRTILSVRTPEGGSYIFPELPPLKVSPAQFVKILRAQANLIVTPGSEFGPSSQQSIRLNYSQDRRAAVEAVDRLLTLVERYRR